jgi:hypothetical protein
VGIKPLAGVTPKEVDVGYVEVCDVVGDGHSHDARAMLVSLPVTAVKPRCVEL